MSKIFNTTTSLMMQARARVRHISRFNAGNLAIQIEYEDENYTYISSRYLHKEIKADVEEIKRPITIHYNKNAQPIAESRQKEVFS